MIIARRMQRINKTQSAIPRRRREIVEDFMKSILLQRSSVTVFQNRTLHVRKNNVVKISDKTIPICPELYQSACKYGLSVKLSAQQR